MLPTSQPFFPLVVGVAALFTLAGLAMLVLFPRALALFRKRWAESYRPKPVPADGGPTAGLVVTIALVLVVIGGAFTVFGYLVATGQVRPQDGGHSAAILMGGLLAVAGIGGVLARAKLNWAMDTLSRMTYGRAGTATSFTPGVTLAVSIVVAAIGFAILAWGLLG